MCSTDALWARGWNAALGLWFCPPLLAPDWHFLFAGERTRRWCYRGTGVGFETGSGRKINKTNNNQTHVYFPCNVMRLIHGGGGPPSASLIKLCYSAPLFSHLNTRHLCTLEEKLPPNSTRVCLLPQLRRNLQIPKTNPSGKRQRRVPDDPGRKQGRSGSTATGKSGRSLRREPANQKQCVD